MYTHLLSDLNYVESDLPQRVSTESARSGSLGLDLRHVKRNTSRSSPPALAQAQPTRSDPPGLAPARPTFHWALTAAYLLVLTAIK